MQGVVVLSVIIISVIILFVIVECVFILKLLTDDWKDFSKKYFKIKKLGSAINNYKN